MVIKSIFRPLVILLALLASAVFFAAPAGAGGPYSALVIDAASGRVLYEHASHEQRYPASLTKMMTLYLLFDALQRHRIYLNQSFRVSQEAASQAPSKLGLRAGDTITVEQAIYGLVTQSANDVAVTVAEGLAGSQEAFAQQMTQQARTLGMTQTYFRNPSGLPDPDQMTTAWDMARLAKALLRDFPQYYRYFSTSSFAFRNRVFRNHNHLLESYAGADGIKTGFIRDSGFNLVASASRDGRRLIGVVFGGDTARLRDAHMRAILDWAFTQPGGRIASTDFEQPAGFNDTSLATDHTASATQTDDFVAQGGEDDTSPEKGPTISMLRVPQTSLDAPQAMYGSRSSWQIQLGIFPDSATAERRAAAAVATLNRRGQARVAVLPMPVKGQTLYRSCLQGLSRDEAATACVILQRNQIHCVLLPPTG